MFPKMGKTFPDEDGRRVDRLEYQAAISAALTDPRLISLYRICPEFPPTFRTLADVGRDNAWQPGRESASAISTARAGDASFPADANIAEVRRRPSALRLREVGSFTVSQPDNRERRPIGRMLGARRTRRIIQNIQNNTLQGRSVRDFPVRRQRP